MPYKVKAKANEAAKLRMQRMRAKQGVTQGVTDVTPKAPVVTPEQVVVKPLTEQHRAENIQAERNRKYLANYLNVRLGAENRSNKIDCREGTCLSEV